MKNIKIITTADSGGLIDQIIANERIQLTNFIMFGHINYALEKIFDYVLIFWLEFALLEVRRTFPLRACRIY